MGAYLHELQPYEGMLAGYDYTDESNTKQRRMQVGYIQPRSA